MLRGSVVILAALASALGALGGPSPAEAAVTVWPPPLARYREAHAALAGGDYAQARAAFEGLPASFVLADYAAFFAAESLLRAGEEATALERFRSFPDRFADSVLVPAALLAATDTAFRLGHWADAEREARRFLGRSPAHPEAGRILVRLAEARAAQGQVAEAIADLRRRVLEAPASSWGEAARETMETLSRFHGLPVAPASPEELFSQAHRLIDAAELSAGVRVLEEALALNPEPAFRHRVLARLAPTLGRLGRGGEGIDRLQAALLEPPTPSRPSLLYELGRLHVRSGQGAAGASAFERLITEHADASLAPDAWVALARTRADLGQPETARPTYRALLAAHGEAGVAGSARWELAWLEYRAGRLREAALEFRQLAGASPAHRLAGLYWSARALDALGDKAGAAGLYREVLGRGPNSYYGFLAERRVRGKPPAPMAAAVTLAPDPLASLEPEPRYRKARALASVGQDGYALLELETLGKDAIVESDRAWSLAAAFAQIGEVGRSLRTLRRALGAAAEGGAPGLGAQFWRLYYPLGYAEAVRDAARRAGLDPLFVAAVIREESSYDPRARSWVGAIGLMQLMPETARLAAANLGLPLSDPARVWDPPVNIALGTHYLSQLRTRFGEPLLAAAGYNAGPHRVQRWVEKRSTQDLEEFVDQIPFDETRAFVKRVYTSWHQYRRIYGASERGPQRGTVEAAPRRPE